MTKRSKIISFFLFIIFISLPTSILAEESISVGTKGINDIARHYAWVERLSIGPTLWLSDSKFPEDQDGVFFRVSTVISEIDKIKVTVKEMPKREDS